MSEKLYIVYEEPKDKGEVYKRSLTKSDVHWFVTDERLDLQNYRSLARTRSENWVAHIKAIDLDSLPDYSTKTPVDDMISKLNSELWGRLNFVSPHRITSRGTTNQARDSVTFSFTLNPMDERYCNNRKSVVHKENIESFYLEQAAFNNVFEILLDKYLTDIDFITPVKINVNGKTVRKIQPTK